MTTSGGTLGKVSRCTLSNAKTLTVGKSKYCAIDQGYKSQSQAIAHCKTLNARLPLPKSRLELAIFHKAFPNRTWIDIRDPVRDRY